MPNQLAEDDLALSATREYICETCGWTATARINASGFMGPDDASNMATASTAMRDHLQESHPSAWLARDSGNWPFRTRYLAPVVEAEPIIGREEAVREAFSARYGDGTGEPDGWTPCDAMGPRGHRQKRCSRPSDHEGVHAVRANDGAVEWPEGRPATFVNLVP